MSWSAPVAFFGKPATAQNNTVFFLILFSQVAKGVT